MTTARPTQARGPTASALRWARGTSPWTALCALAFALFGAGAAFSQAAGNQLQDIQVQALPGNKLQLELKLSGPAPAPLAFTIDNPARIALDLPGTAIALASRRKDVGIGGLSTVLAAEAGGRTRVVLNLDAMTPYETRVAGNSVFVTLGGTAASNGATTFAAAPKEPEAPAADSTKPAAAPAVGRSIRSVDFRRTADGGGRVIVKLSDASTPVDVRQEAGQVILNFANTDLGPNAGRRLDVTDFATPVDKVDLTSAGRSAKLVVSAHGAFQELAYQTDDVFTVEIRANVKEAAAKQATLFSPNKEYTGERLTLNFQDIETRAVLQLLADVSGRNIVVSDTVQGNVTLRLQNVPWDQALDIVLATKGLDKRQNGNVMIIAPADEISAREKADLASRKEIRELEPLTATYLQVNYAKAKDLSALIIGKAGGKNSLLSDRGSVSLDERTNTLLLQDTADRIADIRRLVATLDIPIRQVLIEARIVVANDTFERDLGVQWGFTGTKASGSGLISTTGTAAGNDTIVQSGIANINKGGGPFPVTTPSLDNRFNVNLPVATPAGSIGLAILKSDYLLDLQLSAAQAEGRGQVVSAPRVITANQKEATIKQGVEIPYQDASSSGATTTQFKDAVLSLSVTPQITPDDRIIMDLKIQKDAVGQTITTERGGQVPSIDTRSIETQVLVNNGETVVLGGIYETTDQLNQTKVPVFGDIPYLGALFRSTTKTSNKTELLIFITPKILKEGSNIY